MAHPLIWSGTKIINCSTGAYTDFVGLESDKPAKALFACDSTDKSIIFAALLYNIYDNYMANETLKTILDNITTIPPIPECGVILKKHHRLKCFIHMLKVAPIPTSSESTLKLINDTIVQVEDCHSGEPATENPGYKYKGRMYPIQDDNVERRPNGSIVAITKGNIILIEPTGSFSLLTKIEEDVLLKKRHEN
ncbi:MAG TPA: hypothetical protein VHD33_01810 [Legionellaceae bacterium]|nr:hypothetical protein [Legionellaceae bacterium]